MCQGYIIWLVRSFATIYTLELKVPSSHSIVEYLTNIRGGTISSIFLKIGDRLDAQVFLGVVLYNKHGIFFFFNFKTEFLPPVPGVWKNGPPHYMAKNENHASGLFDSLNEAFWCTDYNAKNLSSLRSPISEKIRKIRQKWQFFQKCNFLRFFVIFSEIGPCRELRFFAL